MPKLDNSWIKTSDVPKSSPKSSLVDQAEMASKVRWDIIKEGKGKQNRYDDYTSSNKPKPSIKTDSAPQVRSGGDIALKLAKFQKKTDHAVMVANEQEKAAERQLAKAKAASLAAKLAQAKAKADPKTLINLRR